MRQRKCRELQLNLNFNTFIYVPISLTIPSDKTSFVKLVICPFKLDRLGRLSPNQAILSVSNRHCAYNYNTNIQLIITDDDHRTHDTLR